MLKLSQVISISVFLAASFFAGILPSGSASRTTPNVKPEIHCVGPFMNRIPTQPELNRAIAEHGQWLASFAQGQNDPRRLNMCLANLADKEFVLYDLRRAVFSGANLSGSDFSDSNLQGADLTAANLGNATLWNVSATGANFSRASLISAMLSGADLSNAEFGGANLTNASLVETNLARARFSWAPDAVPPTILSKADLTRANLTGAILVETKLDGAILRMANFDETSFGVVPGQYLPHFTDWSAGLNLAQIRIERDPHTIFAFRRLRDELKNGGLRNEAKEINASIRRAQMKKKFSVVYFLEYLAFDIPTNWGSEPIRAIKLLVGFIVLFSIPYFIVLIMPDRPGRGAIWRVWSADRILDRENPTQVRSGHAEENTHRSEAEFNDSTNVVTRWPSRREKIFGLPPLHALMFGMYFSVLSAFHFGWHELNVGHWIARIQPHEYVLRPSGWVRTVSGIQSLLCLYMLALWALTFFGNPFD
jgi:uncharacterized protein YjbI with pentapeptide repeats